MEKIIWANSTTLDLKNIDVIEIRNLVKNDQLVYEKKEVVKNGDIRYWNVDSKNNTLFSQFKKFAIDEYVKVKGREPKAAKLMINYIDHEKSPTGSGAGWHRDMWKTQYKAFMYITDVERESQGAFAYLKGSNSLVLRFVSLVNRVITGRNRYSDKYVKLLNKLGFKTVPIFSESLKPFFLNTSLIHRGLEIKEGHRIMATIYLYDQ